MDDALRKLEREVRAAPDDVRLARRYGQELARAGDLRGSFRALARAARGGDVDASMELEPVEPGLRVIAEKRRRGTKKPLEPLVTCGSNLICSLGSTDEETGLGALAPDLELQWRTKIPRHWNVDVCGPDLLCWGNKYGEGPLELRLLDGRTGETVAEARVEGAKRGSPHVVVCGDRIVASWSYKHYDLYPTVFAVVDAGERFGTVIVPPGEEQEQDVIASGWRGFLCTKHRTALEPFFLDGERRDPWSVELPREAVLRGDDAAVLALGLDRCSSIDARTGRVLWTVPRVTLGLSERFELLNSSSSAGDLIPDRLRLAPGYLLVARPKAFDHRQYTTNEHNMRAVREALLEPASLTVIDRATGARRWSWKESRRDVRDAIAMRDVVYSTWSTNELEAHDAKTGAHLWTVRNAGTAAVAHAGAITAFKEDAIARFE